MRDWIEDMKSCNTGRATLCNMLYDYIEEQKIRESSTLMNTIQSFFAILKEKWSESRNQKAIDVFQQAIQEEFFLQSKNIVNYNSERYSRVIDERTLRTQNLDLSKIGWIIDDKPISPRKLRTLENRDLSSIGREYLPSRGLYTWVTKTASVETIRQNNDKDSLASCIRNQLGLHHFRNSQIHLVEIIYSQKVTKQHSFHRPTFFEGCPNDIYRSINSQDGWGKTIDLNTYVLFRLCTTCQKQRWFFGAKGS